MILMEDLSDECPLYSIKLITVTTFDDVTSPDKSDMKYAVISKDVKNF